ncbi:hypothetical protein Z949_2929 [Sulfitobacter guttiformis KCTC 32187]|nr:hypothetical protein Z949_2929 [Sulfitobacter guttiformis KCTC 32187]
MMSFSVIRNHEFHTQESISKGRSGQVKKGEILSGTAGT